MKKLMIIFIVFVVLALAGLAALVYVENKSNPGSTFPEVLSFEVVKPDFVIKGKLLSQVDIWYVPTGSGADSDNNFKIGSARLQNTDSQGNQLWVCPIPKQPFQASHIFARGSSGADSKVNEVFLDITGTTDIYNALWRENKAEVMITEWDNSRTFSFLLNDKFSLKLNENKYPQENLTIDPLDNIIDLGETKDVTMPYYGLDFLVKNKGTSTIRNGDFIININTYEDNGNRIFMGQDFNFNFHYPPQDLLVESNQLVFLTNSSLARVDLPRNDFTDTNLSEASFIIGASREKEIIGKCLNISEQEQKQEDDMTINGIVFKVFEGMDAAAGNRYETTSYRTVMNEACYEAVMMLHYGNIDNYEKGTVKEFDRTKAITDLSGILSSLEIK
jgi:hypothetical protein